MMITSVLSRASSGALHSNKQMVIFRSLIQVPSAACLIHVASGFPRKSWEQTADYERAVSS